MQEVISAVLTPLFQAANAPVCQWWDMQRVWKHYMSVRTGHLLSLIHSTIKMSGIQFMVFKHLTKHPPISFSHLVIHLVSVGIHAEVFVPL